MGACRLGGVWGCRQVYQGTRGKWLPLGRSLLVECPGGSARLLRVLGGESRRCAVGTPRIAGDRSRRRGPCFLALVAGIARKASRRLAPRSGDSLGPATSSGSALRPNQRAYRTATLPRWSVERRPIESIPATRSARHQKRPHSGAQASANDVNRLWEPLVRASAADLQNAVSGVYTLAEDRVSTPLIAAHDPLQPHFFNAWYNSGSGWGAGTTTRGTTC